MIRCTPSFLKRIWKWCLLFFIFHQFLLHFSLLSGFFVKSIVKIILDPILTSLCRHLWLPVLGIGTHFRGPIFVTSICLLCQLKLAADLKFRRFQFWPLQTALQSITFLNRSSIFGQILEFFTNHRIFNKICFFRKIR